MNAEDLGYSRWLADRVALAAKTLDDVRSQHFCCKGEERAREIVKEALTRLLAHDAALLVEGLRDAVRRDSDKAVA